MEVLKAAEIQTILLYILASEYFALKTFLKRVRVAIFHIHQQICFWRKHKKQGVEEGWADFTPILNINIS